MVTRPGRSAVGPLFPQADPLSEPLFPRRHKPLDSERCTLFKPPPSRPHLPPCTATPPGLPVPYTRIRGETVTAVSQRLLAHHGGLRGLFRLDVAELARVRGLGDAKAVRLKATLELGRRLAALSPEERPPVGSPEDVANLLSIEMAALEQEQLRVVLLDTKHRILGTRTVYQGSVNQKW